MPGEEILRGQAPSTFALQGQYPQGFAAIANHNAACPTADPEQTRRTNCAKLMMPGGAPVLFSARLSGAGRSKQEGPYARGHAPHSVVTSARP